MAYELSFSEDAESQMDPRIGGPALIGGICAWPTAPDNVALTLVASIPRNFVEHFLRNENRNYDIISIFTYYSREYFLDLVCYHGNLNELNQIKSGFTFVLCHDLGSPISLGEKIPQKKIEMTKVLPDDSLASGSKVGGLPNYLQSENICIDEAFLMQIYSGDFPDGYKDIFGLVDAIGYIFVDTSQSSNRGLLFVQAT